MLEPRERTRLRKAMQALAEGDRGAFDGAFRVLEPLVDRFVARFVDDGDARADVVQSTLIRAFEHVGDYDAERDPVTWVLGIAAWQVRSLRRDAARRRARGANEPLESIRDATDTEEELARAREREALLGCVADLSSLDRATLLAVLDDERPPVPTATFRKRLERAVRRLRALFKERHGQDRI